MNYGEIVKIFNHHRNTADYAFEKNENQEYYAQELFEKSKVKFLKVYELAGKISFTNGDEIDPFEFEIEWMPEFWYPLTNGKFDEQFYENAVDNYILNNKSVLSEDEIEIKVHDLYHPL